MRHAAATLRLARRPDMDPASEPALQGNFLDRLASSPPPLLTGVLTEKSSQHRHPPPAPPPTQARKPSQAPVLALPSSHVTLCSACPQEVPAGTQGEGRGCLDGVRCMGWCSDLSLGLLTAWTRLPALLAALRRHRQRKSGKKASRLRRKDFGGVASAQSPGSLCSSCQTERKCRGGTRDCPKQLPFDLRASLELCLSVCRVLSSPNPSGPQHLLTP